MAEPHAQPRPHRRRVPRWVWFVAVCTALGAMTSVGVAWGIAWRAPRSSTFSPDHWQRAEDIPVPATFNGPTGPSMRINRHLNPGWDEFLVEVNGGLHPFMKGIDNPLMWQRVSIEKILADPAVKTAVDRHLHALNAHPGYRTEFRVKHAGWPWRCLACEDAANGTAVLRPIDLYGQPTDTGVTPSPFEGGHLLLRNVQRDKERQHAEWNAIFGPASSWPLKDTYHAIIVGNTLLPTFPLWPGLLANTAIYGGAWAAVVGLPALLRRWLRARRGGCPQCGYSREGLKVDAPCPECGRATPAAHDATPTPAAR